MEEKKRIEEFKKKGANETAEEGRCRLLSDKDFLEAWTLLLDTPEWRDKGPRALLMHLDKLAQYPTEFATELIYWAGSIGLSYVVPDNGVETLYNDYLLRKKVEARRR